MATAGSGSEAGGGLASSPQLLRAALEAAFDYRGDVTLTLDGGEKLTGYLSNREFSGGEPFVDLLQASAARPQRIPLGRVQGVELSGKDTASGKSWETWLKKYRSKLEAEARGEKVEAIGLFPEALE